jgi:hypothetical protein
MERAYRIYPKLFRMKSQSAFDYITLQEATALCRYSQEYLSLRARTGKLRAKKLGRNWHTTAAWVQEYIIQTQAYKDMLAQLPRSSEQPVATKEQLTRIFPLPPDNLPVETGAIKWHYIVEQSKRPETDRVWNMRFVLGSSIAFAAAVVLMLFGMAGLEMAGGESNSIIMASEFASHVTRESNKAAQAFIGYVTEHEHMASASQAFSALWQGVALAMESFQNGLKSLIP